MRFHPIIISVFLLVSFSYSELYISEINFINDEFIEIYSDEILYLNSSKIYDENSGFNVLTLVKNSTSPYILIAGSGFISGKNLNDYNCTIYKTDKSQVSNGGLKSAGENITIVVNSTLNLTWAKDKDYSFGQNKTLSYNTSTKSYEISENTFCLPNIFSFSQGNFSDNQTQNDLPENETLLCNQSTFDIKSANIFEDKIKFSFKSDFENFSILYWIEDYLGNIVKEKRETTSLLEKSYTPEKRTEIYKIKADLSSLGCNISKEKIVTFFSGSAGEENNTKTTYEPNSYIEILNAQSLQNSQTNELQYEIYRGDTSKRTIYFFLNSKKVGSAELEKYSKLKGRILLDFKEGKNEIEISGLDVINTLSVYTPNSKNPVKIPEKENQNTNQKQFFNISILNQTGEKIHASTISNIANLTGSCYVLDVRTKVSDEHNLSEGDNFSLNINNSKLKSQFGGNILKLTCKYKKSHLKTFNYESYEFNYSLLKSSKSAITSLSEVENETVLKNSFANINFSGSLDMALSENKKEEIFQDSIKITNMTPQKIYESENQKSGKNSIFYILIGSVSLLSLMLLKW